MKFDRLLRKPAQQKCVFRPNLRSNGDFHAGFRSYWQQPEDERTYGSDVCFSDDSTTVRDCREYKWDGTYSTTHYDFTDSTKQNPLKVILSDADGQLILEAGYQYEFDRYGNRTQRTVWVRTQESGGRQLLEKDSRRMTYYPVEATRPQP